MMKQLALFLMPLLLAATATAQVDPETFRKRQQQMKQQYNSQKQQMRQKYDESRRKVEAEYAAFRQRANEEYAAAVRQAWAQMGVQPAIPKPKEPEPPKPPKPPVDKIPTTTPLPQSEVTPPAKLDPVPLPAIPEHEEYFADNTGRRWDTSEDIQRDEAQVFTWTLDSNFLTLKYTMAFGAVMVRQYVVTFVDNESLVYRDAFGDSFMWDKVVSE